MAGPKEPKLIYVHCMEEARFRLRHAWQLLVAFRSAEAYPARWLSLESAALQYRKSVELLAFASISANEQPYRQLRKDLHRDWNARRMFDDLKRINPDFYPIPITVEQRPDVQIIDEVKEGFLTRDEAVELYGRCSALLHAENRYARPRELNDDVVYFESLRKPFETLLTAFWVRLIPENYRIIVEMNVNSDEPIVGVVARVGGDGG